MRISLCGELKLARVILESAIVRRRRQGTAIGFDNDEVTYWIVLLYRFPARVIPEVKPVLLPLITGSVGKPDYIDARVQYRYLCAAYRWILVLGPVRLILNLRSGFEGKRDGRLDIG